MAIKSRTYANGIAKDREAYRGYLIKAGCGMWHVSKDAHHITSQDTLAAAKAAIDSILD